VFREKIWPQVQSFRVAGSTVLPKHIEQEVLAAARKSQNCTVRVLATAKNIVEGYYSSKGLTFGTISHFDGMENGEVIAHVVEGEITRVQAVFVDENLQAVPGNKGVTHPRVVQREHNFKVGNLYNVEDAKTALQLYRHYEKVVNQGHAHLQSVLQELYAYGQRTNWTVTDDIIQN